MTHTHKASFISELSRKRPRKQQQNRSSLPTCTKHIAAKCHINELNKAVIATTKALRRIRIQDVWLAFAFLAWSGLHILLRLLSLHMCNEYPKKKKKKRRIRPHSMNTTKSNQNLHLRVQCAGPTCSIHMSNKSKPAM